MTDNNIKEEHQKAEAEVEELISFNRPKNLAVGVTRGVGNILGGVVGGAGALVLAPTVGLALGSKAGVIGATVGLIGGALAGVVGAVGMVLGGAVGGVTQIALGVISVPGSIAGPSTGKWWNDVEGKWIETNLTKEAEELKKVPSNDGDILGDAANEKPDEVLRESLTGVKDPYYYEILGVEPHSDESKIKRQYYLLARQFHPDKVGADKEATDKFQHISEAYQVLSDPELRKHYDKEGREGLSPDKTGIALDKNQIDASLLFAFLFGSDKFEEYVGRLATGTSALVGDPNKLSYSDARKLQKRRCTRIALNLTKKLQTWVADDADVEKCMSDWKKEAKELSKYSYGYELIQLLGQVYSLSATQFLGSLDSGIGMPSITKWAKGKAAEMKKNSSKKQSTIDSLKAGLDMMKLTAKAQEEMEKAQTEEERKRIADVLAKDQLAITLQILWTITAVDITSTIHEACQMVFFNKAYDKKVHKRLGKGVAKLGEIFSACPEPEGRETDPFTLYEEATFAATLEIIKQKEDASFNASFRK